LSTHVLYSVSFFLRLSLALSLARQRNFQRGAPARAKKKKNAVERLTSFAGIQLLLLFTILHAILLLQADSGDHTCSRQLYMINVNSLLAI
jgi:hypothetical protein